MAFWIAGSSLFPLARYDLKYLEGAAPNDNKPIPSDGPVGCQLISPTQYIASLGVGIPADGIVISRVFWLDGTSHSSDAK